MFHFNTYCLAWRLRASSCLFDKKKKKTSPNDIAHLNLKYLDMISIPSSHTLLFIRASRFEAGEEGVGGTYFMAISDWKLSSAAVQGFPVHI